MRASAHTLVIQTAFLGDVALTTPLLTALAVRHGPVDIVTTPTPALLIETHPAVRQTISYDKRGADRGWDGLRRLARGLRQERYRRAYIPHRSLRSAALALLARIPCRIGFGGSWSFLYTESRRKPAEGHESDRLLALADGAPAAYPPQLRPTPIDVQAAGAPRWKSTRLNSSHVKISYAVFCLKKKKLSGVKRKTNSNWSSTTTNNSHVEHDIAT